jgi:hypothetical protein
MSAPDYVVEPDVECPNDDPNDVASFTRPPPLGVVMLFRSSWHARCTL